MPKNKPERSIDSYIAGLEPDVAFIMERLRDTVREAAPDAEESIKYNMPLFQFGAGYLYVGAWMKHIGLYPVYPAAPALEKQIAPYRSGKDTVQFPYKNPIPYELVAKIVKARMKQS